MSGLVVRLADPDDAAQVAVIYNAGIDSRLATFETEHRTAADMLERITSTRPPHSFVVAEQAGTVVGWAAMFPYSARPVYAGIAEYSVYVHPDAQGAGVGRLLLTALLERARAQGLHKVTSRIFPRTRRAWSWLSAWASAWSARTSRTRC